MAKQPDFYNGGFYHVYNRGVEKRKVFMDSGDHVRFVHDLYVLNDHFAHEHTRRRIDAFKNIRGETSDIVQRREPLVDIVAWALMPNHYHLLLRQRVDSGVSRFMQKIGTGYTMYFNERYARSGVLFQGLYKVKPVEEDTYLWHLVSYIHLNPVDLFERGWKKKKQCMDPEKVMNKLEEYRWSSYQDYLGKKKNFPSVVSWDQVDNFGLPRAQKQRRVVSEWLNAYEKQRAGFDSLFIDG